MAVGDAVAQFLGTAVANYQPSSGVEVQIMAIIKGNSTDPIHVYDGSNTVTLIAGDRRTNLTFAATSSAGSTNNFNIALNISNTTYVRKTGTTDLVGICGVIVG